MKGREEKEIKQTVGKPKADDTATKVSSVETIDSHTGAVI